MGDVNRCSTTYAGMAQDVRPEDLLLVDDGKILLRVDHVDGNDIVTEVLEGGIVSDNKGINMPGVGVSVPALAEKGHRRSSVGFAGGHGLGRSLVQNEVPRTLPTCMR